jgi:hypothetical protein
MFDAKPRGHVRSADVARRGIGSGPARKACPIGAINMRAVQLTAYGDPLEGLKYVDIPEPGTPGQNQVLIGVEFSPLNQSDLLLARAFTGRVPLFQL